MKLLRVVDKNGDGMYRNLSSYEHCDSLAVQVFHTDDYSDNHPNPSDDIALYNWSIKTFIDHCYFAFGNEKQFLQWIYLPEWRVEMDKLGAKLLVISVPKASCFIGDKQAVYKKADVTEIKEFQITSFDNPELAVEIRKYLNTI